MSVYLRTENGVLYHGDCMEHFGKILKGSVDMVLCDLPYGITNCDWDKKIALAPLWRAWNACLKDDGVICLTAQQPFVTELITSCLRPMKFRYELIWEKSKACGFLNANRMPLRAHENILIFYKKLPHYNPQMTTGKPYITKRGKSKASSVYHFNGKSIDKTFAPFSPAEFFHVSYGLSALHPLFLSVSLQALQDCSCCLCLL